MMNLITDDIKERLEKQLDDIEVFEAEKERREIIFDNSEKILTFRSNDWFKSRWDLIIMLFATFNAFFIPLDVSFDDPALKASSFFIVNSIIDFFFFVDILIMFRTVFIDSTGNECSNSKLMAINYLQTTFIIDVIATVPFDTILQTTQFYKIYKQDLATNNDIPWVDLLGIFKLGRLHRLSIIIGFMNVSGDFKSSLKLSKLVLFLVVYIHCFACGWWFLVKRDQLWIPPVDMPSGDNYKVYSDRVAMSTKYLYSIQIAVWCINGNDS